MNRVYYDISHFRAPYKNWAHLSGFGAAAASALPPEQAVMVDVEADGTAVLKPAIQKTVSDYLQSRVVRIIGDDNNVALDPALAGDIRENAWAWLNRKLNAGMTVLAGSSSGVAGLGMPTEIVQKFLKAVSTNPEAQAATAQGQFAVLARPAASGKPPIKAEPSLFAKIGPVATIGVLAAGGVLAYLLLIKKRGHGHTAR